MALLIVIVFVAVVGGAVVNVQSIGQALFMLIFVPSGIFGVRWRINKAIGITHWPFRLVRQVSFEQRAGL